MTWHYAGRNHPPYGWLADRRSTSLADRWQIARNWYERAMAAYHAYQKRMADGTPSWFDADMVCIGLHEEGGHNSVAGFFGFVYPPSSYGEYGYGDSWLNWPLTAQLRVAYHLYQRFGWSPWTTAPGCGL